MIGGGTGYGPVGAVTNQYESPDTPPILCASFGQAETIIAGVE